MITPFPRDSITRFRRRDGGGCRWAARRRVGRRSGDGDGEGDGDGGVKPPMRAAGIIVRRGAVAAGAGATETTKATAGAYRHPYGPPA